jgi:uncharacterized membrane protein
MSDNRETFDPVAEENRTIGQGLFEREMGPSSSMAHLYRGENVWAHGLDPSTELIHEDWREELADDYRNPKLKISYEEALAHRLRRIYLPMVTIVLAAWVIRITAIAPASFPESAAVGAIPGPVVTGVVAALYGVALAIAFRPRDWKGHPELRSRDIGRWQE